MKKVISGFILLTMINTAFCQQIDLSPSLTKQDYHLKSKRQKTAAWVLLAGGFTLSTIGTILASPKATEDIGYTVLLFPNLIAGSAQPKPQNDYTGETILLITGTAAMVASISLFITSGKNKRKAMSLSFINESAPQFQKGSFVYTIIPSLKLKINL